jgi:deazaflavin-dependent oxidoreductase (nitroreductase family)
MALRRRLARFNKVITNRIQGVWAPLLPPWLVVEHRGRRSGRVYRTPTWGVLRGGEVRIRALYGTNSDWVRNLQAAGRGTIVRRGRRLPITDVRVKGATVIARVLPSGPRSFDPVVLGERECGAWVAYYRHEWLPLLRDSLALVSVGFGTGPLRTVYGAWLVLRANQVWAPYPDNDPDAARSYMRRFYALVSRHGRLRLDPVEAARREVEWWRIHRIHQREAGLTEDDLIAAVAHLYSYVYGVAEADVREAARLRVLAMRISDEWVAAGCDLADPQLKDERATLVASYTALRTAIGSETA